MRTFCPICAAALAFALVSPARAEGTGKAGRRVYGPPPAPARRVYGPPRAPGERDAAREQATRSAPPVTTKVAASSETVRPAARSESAARERAPVAPAARPEPRQRPVTIYFVHGEEKQSLVEFTLSIAEETSVGDSEHRAMAFEANKIEADVDGRLLLRGDVRIRFGNGMRLGAQLVSVAVGRDEGALEIVVKE